MSKKKKLLLALFCVAVVALNIVILQHRLPGGGTVELKLDVQSEKTDDLQIYYSPNEEFSEDASSIATYKPDSTGGSTELTFSIDTSTNMLRLDLGSRSGCYRLSNVRAEYKDIQCAVSLELLETAPVHDIKSIQIEKSEQGQEEAVIEADGQDPYVVFQVNISEIRQQYAENASHKSIVINLAIIVIIDLCFLFLLKKWDKVAALPVELFQNRRLIFTLSKNDFKTKYAGSYLGIVWAFVQPVVTILVYWFVFQVGFRSTEVSDFPFVLYLTTGMVPWFFFQDALNGGTNALIEYNYLVKKVVFKISILPIVKIISAAFVHVFFVCFAMLICGLYGYYPSFYSLQLIYYFVCTFVFVLGLVYATSAIVVFFRDLTQIISIALQVGIWMTPIMWDIQMISKYPLLMRIFKLNPMYYIVTGYRDSMLGHVGISAHMMWAVYFWILTAVLFLLGSVIFKRLKVHFADVL